MGSVTALAAVKSLVVASEFLGSVTVSRVQPNSLVPLQVRAVDRSGIFAQATLPLSDTDFLVAAHPFGLVLLKRCADGYNAVATLPLHCLDACYRSRVAICTACNLS